RIPVAVIIDQKDTATHRLHDVFARRRRFVTEVNARFFRDVRELRDIAPGAFRGFRPRRRRRRLRMSLLALRQLDRKKKKNHYAGELSREDHDQGRSMGRRTVASRCFAFSCLYSWSSRSASAIRESLRFAACN